MSKDTAPQQIPTATLKLAVRDFAIGWPLEAATVLFTTALHWGADPMTAPLKQPRPTQPVNPADLLRRLDKIKATGKDRYMACCPAHQDKSPSLSVRFDTPDDRILMNCFAGCDISDICAAIGLEVADLYPRTDRPRYAGLPDWKRRRLEDAMQHMKLLILMFENAQKAGQTLSVKDQADYQQAVARVRKIKEVLRNG